MDEKSRKAAKALNPIDDPMFRKMAESRDFCQEILQVILNDYKLQVIDHTAQYDITNLQGRSVVLDAKCLLGDKRLVNIEVQKPFDDDHQRRVRYNGSVLTANEVKKGSKFKDIPDICMIYIAKVDIFKHDLNVYHIDRSIRETKEVVFNGYEEIYVNAVCTNKSTDVGQLMRVFTEDNAYNEKFPVTSSLKDRYKNREEEITIMSDIIERFYGEELQAAREESKNNLSLLYNKLVRENRNDDIKRISEDYDYRDKLLNEMFPQEAN